MVMTNRDRIDRGMRCLAAGLAPFVDTRMAAAFAGQDWVQALAARGPSGQRYSRSDPRFLLRVITEQWRVFRDGMSRVQQGYATELRDMGNKWAHAETFSDEDTHRMLDTIERLLASIGATGQAGQVRHLRLGPAQPDLPVAASPETDAWPGPPGPGRPVRLAGFWAPVRYEHVLRAIEDYDRLGQDQFLAAHGFGRARDYLLTHHGRRYDSKAILGVAYQHATGVRLRSSEFNGGLSGAAGVLGRLGFQIIRATAPQPAPAHPADAAAPARLLAPKASTASRTRQHPASALAGIDPHACLLVVTCSARKQPGGQPPESAEASTWPPQLGQARGRVLAIARADTSRVLPAWRRYTGTFYQHAQPALADAVTAGRAVIISGGYGIVRASEPIGWYDKILQLADWPAGLLESALISEARRCGTPAVVAFAAASTDYTRLLRRTPWQQVGINAQLVTITGVTGGAMSEVPRRLGQAFSAFWNRQHDSYPSGTTTEPLQ